MVAICKNEEIRSAVKKYHLNTIERIAISKLVKL
jgi:hypothetical protein